MSLFKSFKSNNYDGVYVNAKSSSFLGKVYGYLAIGLLITAIVACGVGLPLYYWIMHASGEEAYRVASIYSTLLIVSAISTFVLSFITVFMGARGKNITLPGCLYVVSMGILLSSLGLYIAPSILIIAFALTGGIFLIMYLVAKLFPNLHWLARICFAFFPVIFITSLINIFIGSESLYLFVEIGIFIVFFLLTLYDTWRIQKIAETGGANNNIALYCAFVLYGDFIYLFVRLVTAISRFSSKR